MAVQMVSPPAGSSSEPHDALQEPVRRAVVWTAAITALDPARASLAGGVVYMCQVGGGSVGLAVNTAIGHHRLVHTRDS